MASKGNKLVFANAEKARDAIVKSQKKEIAKLYQQWADEIGERAKYYSHKSTSSSVVSERQMKELQKQLTETSHQVSNEVYKNIKGNIYTVADAVVKDNVEWMKQFGFSESGLNAAFSSVPDQIVRMLVTGQIYEGGWNLSSRIWSDNEQTLRTAYQIVAKGMAENRTIYDIAKELEKYVQPGAAKKWNPYIMMKNTKTGEWERKKIYKRQVDYNAQRLARTLVQHGYQQSFIAVTEKNPFVLRYQWSANGSRPCPLCQDRDGQTYEKGDLPMDHPNGMCTMIPVIDDQMIDKLADWFNSPDGTYPEIDEFAKGLGYSAPAPKQTETQSKWLSAAGYSNGSMPKDFTEFAHKLTYEQQTALLKEAGYDWSDPHPFQKMEAYYNANIAKAGEGTVAKSTSADISSLGTSKGKTFSYWYTKLDDAQKALAKELKEKSGLTWQQWYEQNIYSGSKKVSASGAAKAATSGTPMPTKSGTAYDTWIKSMRGQTESSMLSTEASQFAKMTESQVNGIIKYSGSSYEEMNGYLRLMAAGKSDAEARRISGISDSQMKAMKEAQNGLRNAALAQDTYLRRGTDVGDLAGFLPGDFETNKRALQNMSVDELRNKFVGTQGIYAGFTSTSSLYDRGFDGSVEVIMHAPPGTEATSIMTISQYGTGEGETLLNSGTKVEITAIEKSDGHMGSSVRVYMEIIGKK